VAEVLSFLASESAGKGIEVAVDLPAELPCLFGDRVQMQQVLLNLLLNAFDAVALRAPGERQVQVRALLVYTKRRKSLSSRRAPRST
jgi:two-component system, LuxR family, sensor kinase FixL